MQKMKNASKESTLALMAHTHCTGPGQGTGQAQQTTMVPRTCPCVVCTVHSIILKPIVFRSLSCPGPVQCVWAIKPRADVT